MTERLIFAAALRKTDAAERDAYLDQACAGDIALREQVETLLAEHDQLGTFLESPFAGVIPLPASDGRSGAQLGPYRLLQQIGEGGFGVVFLAEQTKPVWRRVAIKVIKPGMDTRQVIARFEAERQALAMMDHPNIAHVLDASATDSGRPYFVMELVRGVPITTYCDESRLAIRERLELFSSICQAIQHAHTKGIIHRDIKPTNVLITQQDGRPVVKVIDFGIAKAMGQQLTEKTLFTDFTQMIGTPLYMSPEQAEMSGTDIDTRSDIYSLGVLLYELLTGSTPFDQEQLKRVAFDEIRRIIREDEPPKPSTRIGKSARAGTGGSRLAKQVRGELDWIVMKALEKDRGRRYETANGLALDVQRYLSDEPVHACPPSAWYRCGKFARRHKTGVSLAALTLGFLVIAGVGAGWLARDRSARHAETSTRIESTLQEATRQLDQHNWLEARAAAQRAGVLLTSEDEYPESRRRLDRLVKDLQMINRLERVAEDQLMDLEDFWHPTGADQAYEEAFREYGIDVMRADPAEATKRLKASAIAEQLTPALDSWAWLGRRNADRVNRVRAVLNLADPDPWRIRFRDPAILQSRSALEELADSPDGDTQPPMMLAFLGRALSGQAAPDKAVEVLTAAHRRHPHHFWLNLYLGNVLRWGVKPPRHVESAGYMRAALALRPHVIRVYLELGGSLLSPEHADEAIAQFRRALEIQPDYAHPHHSIGQALALKGNWDQAIQSYQTCLNGNVSPRLAFRVHYDLGNAYAAKQDKNNAILNWQKSIQIEPRYIWSHQALGQAWERQGKLDEALEAYRKALALNSTNVPAHLQVARVLRRQKHWDKATVYDRKALEIDPRCAAAHDGLGWALFNQQQHDEGIASLRTAVALDPDYFNAHQHLVQALTKLGRDVESIPVLKRIVELRPKQATHHTSLAWVLSTASDPNARDPQTAVVHAQIAVDLEPTPNRWSNLGVAQWRAGDVTAAVHSLETADTLWMGDLQHRFFLAMAYWQNGEKDRARAMFDQGLKWFAENKSSDKEFQRVRAEAEELIKPESADSRPTAEM